MDNQDYRKTDHVSGHESHGVHLCHKCGWPFPNPHPSAKNRRAHKRVCGTIEGYKLVDSGEINHGAASDDDHLSDEDQKTPVPKVLDGNREKNIAGIGAVSNRSEDEVFSDVVAEFQDSGFCPGSSNTRENPSNPADKVSGKDLSPNPSFNDCANTDIIQSPESSTERSQGTCTLSGRTLDCHDHASSSKGPVDLFIDGSNVLEQHIKLETSADASEDSKNITTSDGMAECSMFVGQETDAVANKEINVGTNLLDDVGSPINHAGETSEQASKSEKSFKIESATVLTDGVVQLEEDLQETDGKGNPGTKMEGNLMGAAISQGKDVNITYDTVLNAEKKEEVTPHIELADEIIRVEQGPQRVLASNVAAGDISPKAESTEHIGASLDTAYSKVDETQTIEFLNSNEYCNKKGYAVGGAHLLSVPGDIPIVDHAEMMPEDIKDHKKVHLYQSVPLASGEIDRNREGEIQDSLSESRKLGGVDVSASDVHVLGGSFKHEDWNSRPMVAEEVSGEDVLKVNVGSDKIGGSVTTENEICYPEKQKLNDTCDDLRQLAYCGTATRIFSDMNPSVASVDSEVNQIANMVSSNDDAEHEEAETGGCNIAYNDRKDDMEHSVESTIHSIESARNLSKSHVHPLSGLLEDDNAGDHGKAETENFDINQVESAEAQNSEEFSTKTNSISELASNHQENQVNLEDVNDDCLRKLQETDSTHVDEVSKIPEEFKEHEMNGTGEVQGDRAAEFSLAIESDNSGGPDSQKNSEGQTKIESPSEGQTKKELPSFPVDVEATIQSLPSVENNNTGESGEASYGVGFHSLHGEVGNSFIKHQLDTTAVDASVESSSQTDSLEGNWGSVSVLSTPSDIPTSIDTNALPSTDSQPPSEAEKGNVKKPEVASDRQHPDKSDLFEPPSFMTLVEPGGSGQTVAASEMQIRKNPEQLKASAMQAGWFPSLTHTSNESQGRKKNEEIIAKVTNWNVKQNTPLKNLLGAANFENKPTSPNPKNNPYTVIQRDENFLKDNGASAMKVSSVLGHEAPVGKAAKTEAAKEWDSPARYPSDIKRGKRKVKRRPYWAQFVCCSSVN
ncbi:hypothetical protein SLE2022_270450 [Rubroshorea leprosula]